MPGAGGLGKIFFLKPVRRVCQSIPAPWPTLGGPPRAATVMEQLEEARMARLRGFKVAAKSGSMKTALGRFKGLHRRQFLTWHGVRMQTVGVVRAPPGRP